MQKDGKMSGIEIHNVKFTKDPLKVKLGKEKKKRPVTGGETVPQEDTQHLEISPCEYALIIWK